MLESYTLKQNSYRFKEDRLTFTTRNKNKVFSFLSHEIFILFQATINVICSEKKVCITFLTMKQKYNVLYDVK